MVKPDETQPSHARLRVVAIGAAAGGLSALRAVLQRLPVDDRLAVVVASVRGAHDEQVIGALEGGSALRVVPVTGDAELAGGTVHVAPGDRDVVVEEGAVRLAMPAHGGAARAPADRLFRSVASAYGVDSCAIVLSGVGADGAIGIKRVKEAGGVTIVQDPDDAEYDDMPRAAIATGLIDLVVPADAIAPRMVRLLGDLAGTSAAARATEAVSEATLRDVLTLVRMRSGHEFGSYKRATLLRRVSRRMQVCECETLPDYLRFVREHPAELSALMRDFLISVTSFFRDAEMFDSLDRQVLSKIFASKAGERHGQVRLWSIGCASGEEAYSLAILCAEHAARLPAAPQIQIFATDIDDDALADARAGRYPETIAADLSPARLERFFARDGAAYRVKKEIREMVLFSPHNVLRDPPFSRLDLITCRNLLIYLNRDAQDRVLALAHFALRPDGHLMLGASESAESAASRFAALDAKHRIYVRRSAPTVVPVPALFPSVRWSVPPPVATAAPGDRPASYGELHQRIVEVYAPPSILVDSELEIVHVSEHAGRYLVVGGGEPSRHVLKLVLPALRLDLRAALYATREPGARDTRTVAVELDGEPRRIVLSVQAVGGPVFARGMYLILFEERAPEVPSDPAAGPVAAPLGPVVHGLEQELQRTRDQLRATIEQYETSVEELRASNEELHAINEELRSATEELETSKEELYSVNEELTTLNHELKEKVDEVSRANSDLQNLMESTKIAVLFLDRQMNIKRFTPSATELFNVIPTDLGRPLAHLTHRLDANDLTNTARQVLLSLQPVERAIRGTGGRQYLTRIHPYRSVEDRIDGVVITFLDVTALKEAEESLRMRETMLRLAERAADAGVWELDVPSGRMHLSDDSRVLLGVPASVDDPSLDEWLARIHAGDRGVVTTAITRTLRDGADLNVEFRVNHPTRGLRWMWQLGRAEPDASGRARSLAGITIDVTARRRTEAALRASEERFRLALRSAPVMMLNQDTELRYTWGYMLGGNIEFVGKTDHDLFAVDEADRLVGLKREVLASGAGRRAEVALTVAGKVRHYDLAIEPIRQDGAVVGLTSAAIDVTSSKLAELALRTTDRHKDELLASVAHELRNPLTALRAALDVHTHAGEDPATIDAARELMDRQVVQLTRLVDDLLDVSRFADGRAPLQIEHVPVASLVEAGRAAVAALAGAEGQELAVDVPADLSIDGDPVRLIQVLTHVLADASRHAGAGGHVRVTASRDERADAITIRVADGGGLDPSAPPGVGDLPTPNGDGDGDGDGSGAPGLGLYLVRRIVELHGGAVTARREGADADAELIITLPVHHAGEVAPRPGPRAIAATPGARRRVLVVDDNRDITAAVTDVVRMLGHHTEKAHDGPAALEAFDAFRPEVVLLDLGMPGMNGYEVARRIRERPGGADVTLVAVTGWGQPVDIARTCEGGFDQHLVKPAGLLVLRELLGDATRAP